MKRLLRTLSLIGFVAISIRVLASELPTLILYNGNVIPMTSQEDSAEAIALEGNRILAIGSDVEMLALAGSSTQRIDLQGGSVVPGFIDPHTHLLDDSWNRGLSPLEAQQLALQYGITSAANMYTSPDLVQEYVEMAQRGDLRVRFSLYLIYNTSCGEVLGDWYAQYAPLVELAPRLRIGGVKIFSETSVCGDDLIGISFTPALRSLLSPAGVAWYGSHRPLFTTDELARVLQGASDRGFPVAIHAIGDGGVQLSLDAIEAALEGEPNSLRHTILHNLFIRDDLLNRYEALGVIAAIEPMTPCFVPFYQDLLPLESKHIVRRWGDLVASGAHVTADSDWPWCAEEAINPLFRLQALASPINHSQSYEDWEPCGRLAEEQLLTAWQALHMMTFEAAFMLHQEAQLGTLEPGKLADLVVLSADPLQASIENLTSIEVLLTLVDGVIEYQK